MTASIDAQIAAVTRHYRKTMEPIWGDVIATLRKVKEQQAQDVKMAGAVRDVVRAKGKS